MAKTINKTDLVEAITARAGVKRSEAAAALDAVMDAITEALSNGDKVQLTGFGSFEVRSRAARTAKNPRTGEAVEVPAANVPAFKAGKALKDAVK